LRLLLDTAYLLPAIGISVKGIPQNAPIKLIEGEHQISISDITIFEISASGAKQTILGSLTTDRVSRGVRVIIYDDRIERIPIYDTSVLPYAFTLRRTLNNFIDCITLSSGINRCDIIVTEDKDIHDLKEETESQELLQTVNPRFNVQALTEILQLSYRSARANAWGPTRGRWRRS